MTARTTPGETDASGASDAARQARSAERIRRWEQWLALQTESAVEPDLPIVDAHHHLWDRGGHRYLAREFRADGRGHRVIASVFVECLSSYDAGAPPELAPVGETAFVASLGEREDAIAAAIVAAADLALGDRVAAVLDAHAVAARGALRGVRYVTAWDPSPLVHGSYATRADMLHEPAVLRGAAQLAARGLVLDLWMYFHQLDDAIALARACPELAIVVDHCGGPIGVGPHAGERAAVFRQWCTGIAELAGCPNVSMKIGGLAMPLAGFGWRELAAPPGSDVLAAAWRPYVEACIDAFGPERCMFGSNFPVDRTGCTYASLWNAFKTLSRGYGADQRTALFEATARRVYGLRAPSP